MTFWSFCNSSYAESENITSCLAPLITIFLSSVNLGLIFCLAGSQLRFSNAVTENLISSAISLDACSEDLPKCFVAYITASSSIVCHEEAGFRIIAYF